MWETIVIYMWESIVVCKRVFDWNGTNTKFSVPDWLSLKTEEAKFYGELEKLESSRIWPSFVNIIDRGTGKPAETRSIHLMPSFRSDVRPCTDSYAVGLKQNFWQSSFLFQILQKKNHIFMMRREKKVVFVC